MTIKLQVHEVKTTDKLNVRQLQVNKCTIVPKDGQKLLNREAMMSVNAISPLGVVAKGDVLEVQGTIVREDFVTPEGETKSMQWFVPE